MTLSSKIPPMRIGWLIFTPIIGSGGFSNIFRIINLLSEFGHENILFIHRGKLIWDGINDPAQYIRTHFGHVSAKIAFYPQDIDNVDILLATEWSTFEFLDLARPHIAQGYFVQDFEPFFLPMGYQYIRAEATYRSNIPCITLGHWLATFLHDTYGATTYPFDFAVEHELYYPQPKDNLVKPRIIFYARSSTPRRCFELGVQALKIVKAQCDVDIIFFGDNTLEHHALDFEYVNKGILNHKALSELYATATIGLVLSATNPSLMPLEMMASRCLVVDLDLPPNHFLINHNQTGLLAEPNPTALANAMIDILQNSHTLNQIVDQAEKHVKNYSWEASARQVEQSLWHIVQQHNTYQERENDMSIVYDHWIGDGVSPYITDDLSIGQRFIIPSDGLCCITFAISEKSKEIPLLRLYDGLDNSALILETNEGIYTENTLSYTFAPIYGIQNNIVYCTLSAKSGPRLRFDYHPSSGGSITYNDVPQLGQLVFRAYSRNNKSNDHYFASEEYLYLKNMVSSYEYQSLAKYHQKIQHYYETQPTLRRMWIHRLQDGLLLLRKGNIRELTTKSLSYVRWITKNTR